MHLGSVCAALHDPGGAAKLQENGLVRIVPYKGTTVTRLNRRIVDELIYERTAVRGASCAICPHRHPGAAGADPCAGGRVRSSAHVESPDFNKLYRSRLPPARRGFLPWTRCTCGAPCRTPTPITAALHAGHHGPPAGWTRWIADHRNPLNAIERCDLAAFEPPVAAPIRRYPPPLAAS